MGRIDIANRYRQQKPEIEPDAVPQSAPGNTHPVPEVAPKNDSPTPEPTQVISPKYGEAPQSGVSTSPTAIVGSGPDKNHIKYSELGRKLTPTVDRNTRSEYIQELSPSEAMRDGSVSWKEYVDNLKSKAKSEGRELTGYEMALDMIHGEDDETPEQKRKRERREELGQVFANLGNVIGNAANLYYTAKGAQPIDLNTSARYENERMQRIKEKRDALKEKEDAILMNARMGDVNYSRSLQAAREKAAESRAEKDAQNYYDWLKFNKNLGAQQEKADKDRGVRENQLGEQNRHNRAQEAIGRMNAETAKKRLDKDTNKIVDSAIGSDGNIYTRNSRLTESEAKQLVLSSLSNEELSPFVIEEKDYRGNVTKSKTDWIAAAAYALQEGLIEPEELKSRGFKPGGAREKDARQVQARNAAKGNSALGWGKQNNNNETDW